jgi:hypothetical protein
MSKTKRQSVNAITKLTLEEIEGMKDIGNIQQAVMSINQQSAACIELQARIAPSSTKADLDQLQGAVEAIQFVSFNLYQAVTSLLLAQSSVLSIVALTDITINKIMRYAKIFHRYLPHLISRLDTILEHVENKELLPELRRSCEKTKQEVILTFCSYFKNMLEALEEADGIVEERERENPGVFGPKQASFASFFPRPRELAHQLLRASAAAKEEEEEEEPERPHAPFNDFNAAEVDAMLAAGAAGETEVYQPAASVAGGSSWATAWTSGTS